MTPMVRLDADNLRLVMQNGQGHADFHTMEAMATESKHEITMNLYT